MVVGICRIALRLPGVRSLKAKRRVLSGLKARLCARLTVSVAELDEQDVWQRAVLGIACISNESRQAHRVLDQSLNVIRATPALELLDVHIELV